MVENNKGVNEDGSPTSEKPDGSGGQGGQEKTVPLEVLEAERMVNKTKIETLNKELATRDGTLTFVRDRIGKYPALAKFFGDNPPSGDEDISQIKKDVEDSFAGEDISKKEMASIRRELSSLKAEIAQSNQLTQSSIMNTKKRELDNAFETEFPKESGFTEEVLGKEIYKELKADFYGTIIDAVGKAVREGVEPSPKIIKDAVIKKRKIFQKIVDLEKKKVNEQISATVPKKGETASGVTGGSSSLTSTPEDKPKTLREVNEQTEKELEVLFSKK